MARPVILGALGASVLIGGLALGLVRAQENTMEVSTDIEAFGRMTEIQPAPETVEWVVIEREASSDWSLHAVLRYGDAGAAAAALGALPEAGGAITPPPEALGAALIAGAPSHDAGEWARPPLMDGVAQPLDGAAVYVAFYTR